MLESTGGGLDQSAGTRKRRHCGYVGDGCLTSGRGVIFPGSYRVQFQIDCNCSNLGYSGTVGWDFQVNSAQSISYLGVYDADADGLAVATDVGLWNRDTGVLLSSATVPLGTAGQLLGQFRYVPISSLALQPGVNYALGAQYNQPSNSDWYQLITTNNSFAPWLNFFNPTEKGGVSLTLPSNVGQSPYGIYGPNIAKDETPHVPGPLSILGVGAAFGFSRKLRKRITLASSKA